MEEKLDELIALANVYELPLAMILHAYRGAKYSGQTNVLTDAIAKCIVEELKPALENAKAQHN